MAIINNIDAHSKYIGENRNDYEELIGVFKQINYKIKSMMITHDQIGNLPHMRSSKLTIFYKYFTI